MKRKANYNVKHKPGGGAYSQDVPEKRRNSRLRPINREAKTGSPFKDAIFGILLCFLGIVLMRLIL